VQPSNESDAGNDYFFSSHFLFHLCPLLGRLSVDESGSSGSDFSEAEQAKRAVRQKRAALGHTISDTESEDQQLDRELSAEVVASDREVDSGKRRAKPKPTNREGKGKNRAQTEDDDEEQSDGQWPRVTGPLPKAAKEEAIRLAEYVMAEAEKIARKYKKSTREIMLAAGLGVRASRSKNPMNMFRKWYSHQHPNNGREFLVFAYKLFH
jgi:hypothetical protein